MRACFLDRCSLCGLQFNQGDDVVFVGNSGFDTPKKKYNSMIVSEDIIYSRCPGACPFDERVEGCHAECTEFVSSLDSRTALLKATSHQYEPLLARDERRTLWLHSRWSSILGTTTPLPVELCNQIARYCLRQFAIVYAQASLEKTPHSVTTKVSTLGKIWARYTIFEGVKYIASLSNEKPDTDGIDVALIHDTDTIHVSTCIYIAEDHLGIRHIVLVPSSETPIFQTVVNGIWWRKLEIPSSSPVFSTVTDGIKLRSLSVADSSSVPCASALWAVPFSSPELSRWVPICRMYKNLHPLRMSAVQLNQPDIFAYSVSFFIGILSIHAHTPGESTEFYRSVPPQAVWCYMPVEQGEWIVKIWKHSGMNPRESALMFETNKNRVEVMGIYRATTWNRSTWSLVDRPTQPGRLFFNVSRNSSIQELVFETPAPTPCEEDLVLPTPSSPKPESLSTEEFYFTSASLDGVRSLNLCEVRQGETVHIIGIILTYSDGQTSCVGQIRRDCLCPTLPVTGSETLWLGFALDESQPCVGKVEISRPSSDLMSSYTWLDIPWTGRLEWWFSIRQCKVYYHGRSSPDAQPLG